MFSTTIPQPLRHQDKKVAATVDSINVRQYTACRVTIALFWLHVKFDNSTIKCLYEGDLAISVRTPSQKSEQSWQENPQYITG
jgi:hypothetical protein